MFAFVRRGALAACLLVSSTALAHVELISGPAPAGKSAEITFAIGHGCEDANGTKIDTYKVRVDIPAGVTGVRVVQTDFGKAVPIKNGADIVAFEWTRDTSLLLDDDVNYYKITVRAKVPDAPYTKLQWNVTQSCRSASGTEAGPVLWDQPEDSTAGNPAPIVTVAPAHVAGWNKLTIPTGVTVAHADLPTYFGDAQIVWKGTSAYSPNSNTNAQIASTAGVTPLDGDLVAGDEVWVRY